MSSGHQILRNLIVREVMVPEVVNGAYIALYLINVVAISSKSYWRSLNVKKVPAPKIPCI